MRDVVSDGRQHGPAVVRPGRRRFLMLGAGCAVPLVAGSVGWIRAAGAAPSGAAAPTDSVLDHARRQLAWNYHAMRGPAGIRGEHVRSLAANLDLIAVCLESEGGASQVDAALRRGLEQKGREEASAEYVASFWDVAAELRLQYGIESPGEIDAARAASALDVLAARGALAELRRPRSGLNRLAVELDRQEAVRSPARKPMMVHQKPGDDFLGYPPGSVFDGLTLCQFIQACQYSLEVLVGILAMTTGGVTAAGAAGLVALTLELLKLLACKQDVDL